MRRNRTVPVLAMLLAAGSHLSGCGGDAAYDADMDAATAAVPAPEPPPPPKPKWQKLLNGTDLTGWMVGGNDLTGKASSSPQGGWVVEDGVLARKGRAGYIWSKERFADFVLDFEFNTTGNSGLFFRVDNIRNCVQTGIEMQILPSGGPDKRHGLGSIYDLQAPNQKVGKPGEWNHATLTCDDNMITVELNGQKVNVMDLNKWDTPRKNPDGSKNKFGTALKDFKRDGHIGFQDHGAKVMYRNIKIRKLNLD